MDEREQKEQQIVFLRDAWYAQTDKYRFAKKVLRDVHDDPEMRSAAMVDRQNAYLRSDQILDAYNVISKELGELATSA